MDLRCDHPWPPYDALQVTTATHRDGDVAARVAVRFDELFESLRLIRADLRRAAGGRHRAPSSGLPPDAPVGAGWVEGWRGEVFVALELERRRATHPALPLPRSVVAELAGARACGDRQHRSRLSADQQVLQPQLFGARPVSRARQILGRCGSIRQIARTGIRSEAPPRRRRAAGRGRADPARAARHPRPGAGDPPGRRRLVQRLRAGDPRARQPLLQPRGPGHPFVASPRHADLLLVTGPVSRHMELALRAHLRGDARPPSWSSRSATAAATAASSARATPAAAASRT